MKVKKSKSCKLVASVLLYAILLCGCDMKVTTDNVVENTVDIEQELVPTLISPSSFSAVIINDEEIKGNIEEANIVLSDEEEREIFDDDKLSMMDVTYKTYAKAINDTTIYDSNSDKKIGKLYSTCYLPVELVDGECRVQYKDQIGLVNPDDIEIMQREVFDGTAIGTYLVTSDTLLYRSDDKNPVDAYEVNANEVIDVYADFGDYVLGVTGDGCGYIEKEALQQLVGNFVVIDLSDQEIRLYVDGVFYAKSPVITGKPTSSTYEGVYSVLKKAKDTYLKGPTWNSHVDYWIKFDGKHAIGIHDASWQKGIFGGERYANGHGSHGCVNTPDDFIGIIYDNIQKEDTVVVKK